MMQTMRNLAHTKLVKGLMIILMISFALWGIGDIFRGNPLERKVAKIGKISVTVQELNSAFDQQLSRARQMFGPDLTAQQAKKIGILDKTLDGIIQRAEIDQAIQKLGIDISPKVVLDEVAAQPQFRDKDGKFNQALFRQLLQQAHLNESTFLADGQKDMERQQIVDSFRIEGKPPQLITDSLYKARGQKRILDVITIKNDSITNIPTADDKVLNDYYKRNPQSFTAPEYRGLTIARLSTDDIAKDIHISDEQLQEEYTAKRDQLAQPERRDIVQVVLQDEARAKKLADEAKASGNLTAAAKDAGYDALPINKTDEKNLPEELAKPVFALSLHQISEPIKSSLGWHVVQIKKITPAGTPELGAIKTELREALQRDQAIENATKQVNQLDDQLAAGHSLDDIADGMKLRLIKINAVDSTGKTPDGKDPAEFPNKDNVLKSAFAQNAGDNSPILDDKQGNYFVVRTDSVTPSAVKPFAQVKTEVASAWKTEQQAITAKIQAERVAKELRDGKKLEAGVTMRTADPISMLGDNDEQLPPSVLPQVYRLKKGEVATATAGNLQIVMRLAKLVEADAAPEPAKLKISEEIKKNAPTELTQQYLDYLKQAFPVEINQDTMETIRQQGS